MLLLHLPEVAPALFVPLIMGQAPRLPAHAALLGWCECPSYVAHCLAGCHNGACGALGRVLQVVGVHRELDAAVHLWHQVRARIMPWCFVTVPGCVWFTIGWCKDAWKKTLTLGIREPPLLDWDSDMTVKRSDFVCAVLRHRGPGARETASRVAGPRPRRACARNVIDL